MDLHVDMTAHFMTLPVLQMDWRHYVCRLSVCMCLSAFVHSPTSLLSTLVVVCVCFVPKCRLSLVRSCCFRFGGRAAW